MLKTYDVGSLPLKVDEYTIKQGANRITTIIPLVDNSDQSSKVFENEIVDAFKDKIRAGIDIPNYPQFRDMNEMYFELLKGIEKKDDGYTALISPSAKPGRAVPEMEVIKRNVSRIVDETGIEKVKIKICVTGPYTLASFFHLKTPNLYEELGHALSEIATRSIFNSKMSEVALVCIDEPVLGFLNDPLLDYGSDGRESLRKAWEEICRTISICGAKTSMHLHDTSDTLFWEVENLQIVESHVEDPLFKIEATKKRLEETDKFLKASIAITQFDNLIEATLMDQDNLNVQQEIGDTWNAIRKNEVNPIKFIETKRKMLSHLQKTIKSFGEVRVPYAGPECGLGSWPTYDSAIEGLRRVSGVVEDYNRKKYG